MKAKPVSVFMLGFLCSLAGCADAGPTEQELRGMLGKPMATVVGALQLSTNQIVAFAEPPGVWRGCTGILRARPPIGVDVYVARTNAVEVIGRRVMPQEFLEMPVAGIVLRYSPQLNRDDLIVADGIPRVVR
jgi:hypothetical protein